jgi:hypothetical protein
VGKSVTVSVTIGDIASTNGLLVTLSGVDPKIASAPTTVTIPQGSNTANFVVTGVAVGNTSITVTAAGHTPASAPVNVRQNQIVLPPSVLVAPGASVQFPITLSDPAPPGGLTVSLSTVRPSTGTVDSPVTIPAGATQAMATARGISTDKNNSISANAANFTGTSTVLQVETIIANFADPANGNVLNQPIAVPVTSFWTSRSVVLSDAAPPGGLTIAINVGNTSLASTSSPSVTIPAGQLTSAPFTITGSQQGSTTLSSSATALTGVSVNLVVGPPPTISFLNSGTPLTVSAGMRRSFIGIALNTPAPPGGLTVTFSSNDTAHVATPASVTIPGNQTSASFSVSGVAPTTQAVTVTASATSGNVRWTSQTMPVNVVQPVIVLFNVVTPRTVGAAPNNILAEFCQTVSNCPDEERCDGESDDGDDPGWLAGDLANRAAGDDQPEHAEPGWHLYRQRDGHRVRDSGGAGGGHGKPAGDHVPEFRLAADRERGHAPRLRWDFARYSGTGGRTDRHLQQQ